MPRAKKAVKVIANKTEENIHVAPDPDTDSAALRAAREMFNAGKPQRAPRAPRPKLDSPAIQALQSDIVFLVRQRTEARENTAIAKASLDRARIDFNMAEDRLNGLEKEVQYQMSLISQMRGEPNPPHFSDRPQAAISPSGFTYDYTYDVRPESRLQVVGNQDQRFQQAGGEHYDPNAEAPGIPTSLTGLSSIPARRLNPDAPQDIRAEQAERLI